MTGGRRPRRGASDTALSVPVRALVFGALWLSLAGDMDGWWLGVVTVALATLASMWLIRPGTTHLSLRGFAGLAGFFFRESFRGGVDVASRAFRPSMPLAPAIVTYDVRVRDGAPALLLGAMASLIPGTVSAEREDDGRLILHVIDTGLPYREKVAALEEHIGRLFGQALDDRTG